MYKQIILLAVLATAEAILTTNASCNFESLQVNLPTANLSETMYEISRTPNTWQSGQCVSWTLERNNNIPSAVYITEVVNQKLVQINGTITPTADYVFQINSANFSSNFTFLGLTDEYLLLYACSNEGENKNEYIWKLSNTTTLSESAKNETDQILNKNGFENLEWNNTSHSTEACHTGGAATFKISSFIVLLVGIATSKGL